MNYIFKNTTLIIRIAQSILFLMPSLQLNAILPDFNTSMMSTPAYSPLQALKYPVWEQVATRYHHYIVQNPYSNTERCIPKITHRIWLGSKLPSNSVHFGQSWSKANPQWIHILWTDNSENFNMGHLITPSTLKQVSRYLSRLNSGTHTIVVNINELTFSTRKHFDARKNYGEKSDILRYEILYQCGGLYIDTDFECIQPFDIFNESCDFYAGVSYQSSSFEVFNGLIGSIQKHPILKTCIQEILKQNPIQRNRAALAIIKRTGPHFFASIIEEYLATNLQDKTVIFPITYFYPWPNFHLDQNSPEEIEQWLKPETHAIHRWGMSWLHN